MNLSRFHLCGLIAVAIAAGAAQASERQAYKQVDEKGNVTYSQTPPVQGKEVKKVDITPAHAGQGGVTQGAGDPSYLYQRNMQNQDEYQRRMQQAQNQQKEAQQKRAEALKAECNRNRGTDCENPQTLRDMEAQKIPGGRHYPLR